MSKLKLMYDVVSTMKEKEVISGTFLAEGKKDQIKVAAFYNEFAKNLVNGETKVKISSEMDYEGKKVKHESQTEFSGHKPHGFWKHFHHHHNHQHDHNYGYPNNCQSPEECGGGFKRNLTRLAFVLNILNQITVEEKEDKSVLLSLNLKDIPDDLKKVLQERMNQRRISEHHQHQCFMKEFCNLKEPKIGINFWITKTREVERINITVEGKQIDELNNSHDMNLSAELRLA